MHLQNVSLKRQDFAKAMNWHEILLILAGDFNDA